LMKDALISKEAEVSVHMHTAPCKYFDQTQMLRGPLRSVLVQFHSLPGRAV
jgi:hypothetical protein